MGSGRSVATARLPWRGRVPGTRERPPLEIGGQRAAHRLGQPAAMASWPPARPGALRGAPRPPRRPRPGPAPPRPRALPRVSHSCASRGSGRDLLSRQALTTPAAWAGAPGAGEGSMRAPAGGSVASQLGRLVGAAKARPATSLAPARRVGLHSSVIGPGLATGAALADVPPPALGSRVARERGRGLRASPTRARRALACCRCLALESQPQGLSHGRVTPGCPTCPAFGPSPAKPPIA
jgi:hypothetical protein